MSLVDEILGLVESLVNSILGAVVQFLLGFGIDIDLPDINL
jgi:hypothetical protein